MMIPPLYKTTLIAGLGLAIAGCSGPAGKDETMEQTGSTAIMANDVHSFARPDEAVIKHLALDLDVDFDNKTLSGTVTLDIETAPGTNRLWLDTRDLSIEKITLDGGKETTFQLGDAVEFLGQPLEVAIGDSTKQVAIQYRTSPGAAALQWLEPAQTHGGRHPFLFTQSQAILARTWIPLQDSPGIKFTYDAEIRCPAELMALMSAENDTALHADGVYRFRMPQPVPSYLMALAVGNLEYHAYSDTCGVYAEPGLLEASRHEFADLPAMITSAESLYGPYLWGRYDLLVLPPSFPFGGMENPRLTFATPTIIAGDRSLVALVAHELAHSWSGNLVTNSTWNDFWLNEGFTVYFEGRIMEQIYGKEYADMLTVLGMNELRGTVEELGADNPDTRLYLDLEGRDPDEGVTDIAYEKGRFFLLTIERAVGREKWDAFLSGYFSKFEFGTMTTKRFLGYLDSELLSNDTSLRESINVDAWVYGTGLPDNFPTVSSTALDQAAAAAQAFRGGAGPEAIDTTGWTTHHWLHFLRSLGDSLDPAGMEKLDRAYRLTASGNSEIQCDWFKHCIRNGYSPADTRIREFLMHVGRRKFLKPIYSAMAQTDEGKQKALAIYRDARPGYHAVSTHTLDEILGYQP